MNQHVNRAATFASICAARSEEELDRLARIKRFNEYVAGDASFREELIAAQDDLGDLFDRYEFGLDPDALRPLFDRRYHAFRFDKANPDRWPDAALWDAFLSDKLAHRDYVRNVGSNSRDRRFNQWRTRQIRRCASELGVQADSIVHSIVAYELSSGCSVGCWFCGISAEKFQGHFPHSPENVELWRGVLQTMVDRFGTAARTGFCYWATDPCDNPDYAAFLADKLEITGVLPQTTTAAPLKNVALTRKILAMSEANAYTINRFSILTTKFLHRVFAEFSPRELLGVELVMQQKDSLQAKSVAGRARTRKRTSDAPATEPKRGVPIGATIACVTGFLVNMPSGTLRLVTPTRASERWPDGYRVLEEGRFRNIDEFDRLIEDMIDRNMPDELPGNAVLRFRSDLEVVMTEDGFVAKSGAGQQTYVHPRFGARLGAMLREGSNSFIDIVDCLGSPGSSVFDLYCEVNGLMASGLLDDEIMLSPEPARMAAAL